MTDQSWIETTSWPYDPAGVDCRTVADAAVGLGVLAPVLLDWAQGVLHQAI